jgi:hypothetical protein
MKEPAIRTRGDALFTLNIDDRIYRCHVSQAALYMLCRDQDSSINQLDAYLCLKGKVQSKVEQLLLRGAAELPEVLEPSHFSG